MNATSGEMAAPVPANGKDIRLLFITRFIRMFAYGFLSVLLVVFLTKRGLSSQEVGLLLSLTLVGDIAVSLWMTTSADRFGRRRTLVLGAALMVLAGVVFALTGNFILLLVAAIVGVISPSGNEVGPFLSVEQAGLSQVLPDDRRTHVFGWYNLVGSLATAIGAGMSGSIVQVLKNAGVNELECYRAVVWAYAGSGVVLAILFMGLSKAVEIGQVANSARIAGTRVFLGLHKSKRVVAKLSGLFMIDAFAGGFVIQSIMAYWFLVKFHVEPATLGGIFFGANILAAISALSASWLASRIGLINTMVFTHLPSNVLLILVPFMPTLPLAILMLLLRFSISQMDVPTRQSYVMAVVAPDERSSAAGVTAVARSVGAAISPSLSTLLLATPYLFAPFLIGGGLKIVYDLLLYRSFSASEASRGRKND